MGVLGQNSSLTGQQHLRNPCTGRTLLIASEIISKRWFIGSLLTDAAVVRTQPPFKNITVALRVKGEIEAESTNGMYSFVSNPSLKIKFIGIRI